MQKGCGSGFNLFNFLEMQKGCASIYLIALRCIYRKAAIYYYEENIDLDKAIEWIDIAFKDSDDLPYWQLRYKALINEKAGKINKAKKYAKKGYDLALKNNLPDGINTLKIIYERLHN